jgi:hypothetical protein
MCLTLLQRIHRSITNLFSRGRSIATVMKEFLDRQSTRLWMWLVTAGTRRNSSIACHFAPGDEERLLQALISMNDVLARAVRS